MDLAVRRLGLPGFGSRIASTAHPVLQVLPLALELLWEPVDPYQLMDFLTLPAGPIPAKAASKLAAALAEQPGLGSGEWKLAMEAARSKENDPDGAVGKRLDAWFGHPGAARATTAPAKLFAKRAALAAQWAMGRGSIEKDEQLREAFEALAGQASLFADLLEQLGGPVNEPQMERLLAGMVEGGLPMIELPAQAGGATLVRGLAEIRDPLSSLVWLGLQTGDAPASPWSASERRALEAAGIMMDRGPRTLAVRRAAERAGFSKIRASALLIDLPGGEGTRRHPVALQALSVYAGKAPLLEDVLAAGGMKGAWAVACEKRDTLEPQPPRPSWTAKPGDLDERETTSAGDLETRLGCPLKWVLTYQAGLHPSSGASIPEGNLLKGAFAHALIEAAFAPGMPRSAREAADRVRVEFRKRIATEAAPLASASAARERFTLERQIAAAAEALHAALERGRYEIVGFEFTPKGELLGRRFEGRIDLLARGHDRHSAIIDLKYTSMRAKYVELLAAGHATQLAVYAAAGAPDGERGVAAGTTAAYLLLAQAKVVTPEGSPLAGARPHETVLGAPAVAKTCSYFAAALEQAEGWLATGKIDARPLLPPEAWPEDAELAIKPYSRYKQSGMEICDFCNFQALCGLRRID